MFKNLFEKYPIFLWHPLVLYIHLILLGILFPPFETEAYKNGGYVDYPRSHDGEISAIVHPYLQVILGGLEGHG